MKIGLIENKNEWNDAVLSLGGTLYHSWEWGETRAHVGWHPWRVMVQEGDTPRAAAQIFERRVPLARSSLLYAACGLAGNDSNPEIVNTLAEWMRRFAAERSAILLRIQTRFDDREAARKSLLCSAGFRPLEDQWSLWNPPRANMVIDISGTEEQLLKKMRKKHQEHIKRAPRSGLKITATDGIDELRVFYGLLLKSSERQGFAVRDFDYFLQIREQLLTAGRGSLFLALMEEHAVAGILCARFGSTCHFLYGGFDWQTRQVHANEALHWDAIRWARNLGCVSYDMLGAGTFYPPAEGNPGYGLYNFKEGLGADLIYSAGYLDLVSKPVRYSALRFVERHTGWVNAARKVRSAMRRLSNAPNASRNTPDGKSKRFAIMRSLRIRIKRGGFWRATRDAAGTLLPSTFQVWSLTIEKVRGEAPARDGVKLLCGAEATSVLKKFRTHATALPVEFYRDEIDNIQTCFFACIGNRPAAIAWAYDHAKPAHFLRMRPGDAEIRSVYSLAEFRGRGLAKTVIAAACHSLFREGFQNIYAVIHFRNEASLRAFRSVGFTKVAELSRPPLFGPRYLTAEQRVESWLDAIARGFRF